MFNAQALADQYVAVWNETDAERRRQQIAALWGPDGQHHLGGDGRILVDYQFIV